MNKNYGAIIFDLDGTLINSVPYHLNSFKQVLAKLGVNVDYNFLEDISGLTSTGMFKELKKKYKFKEDIKKLKIERRKYYFKSVGKKNILFPGVKTTIKKLKKNHKLAIATSSSNESLKNSLSKDLFNLFDVHITADDVKKGKPAPNQINLAIKKLKSKKEETILVGDTIYDAMAAKRAKIDFIGIKTGNHTKKSLKEKGALKVIDKISELNEIL